MKVTHGEPQDEEAQRRLCLQVAQLLPFFHVKVNVHLLEAIANGWFCLFVPVPTGG